MHYHHQNLIELYFRGSLEEDGSGGGGVGGGGGGDCD